MWRKVVEGITSCEYRGAISAPCPWNAKATQIRIWQQRINKQHKIRRQCTVCMCASVAPACLCLSVSLRVSVCLPVSMSVCLPVSMSVCLPVSVSVPQCLRLCLLCLCLPFSLLPSCAPACLCFRVCVCVLSVSLRLCLSVSLWLCRCLSISLCQCLCLSV